MSQTTRRSTVVGVFHERDDAREAIEALKQAGFAADTISILSPDKQATQSMAEETGTHAGSGAATGAVAGGLLGGLGGWLVGIGALAIPGVGPFIAAGAFATALGGAAIGAGVGTTGGPGQGPGTGGGKGTGTGTGTGADTGSGSGGKGSDISHASPRWTIWNRFRFCWAGCWIN